MFTFDLESFASDEVGVAGDWHGNSAWAHHALENLSNTGVKTVLHLGDFGLWPGPAGRKYFFWVNKVLAQLDMYLFVTPGNHENYDQLEKFPVDATDRLRRDPDHERILFFERGARWNWLNVNFLSVGGGASIDAEWRVKGESWWEQEKITDLDVDKAIAGGSADVVLAHDAPDDVALFESHRGGFLPVHVQEYVDHSRSQMKRVVDVAQPHLYMHGHYHVYKDHVTTLRVNDKYEFYDLRTVCLNKEYTTRNYGILNLFNYDVSFARVDLCND